MPYIEQKQRLYLNFDNSIESFVDNIKKCPNYSDNRAGILNYVLTNILIKILNNKVSYSGINELTGVLECVKLEMYRRLAAPYEDKKIEQNGDVY